MKAIKRNKKVINSSYITATLMVFGISLAYAEPAIVQISVGSCSIVDGNGTPTGPIFPEDSRYRMKVKISTDSANDNLNMSCHLQNIPNDTGRTVFYDYESTGETCSISDPRTGVVRDTYNWHATISPTGNVVFSCHAKSQL